MRTVSTKCCFILLLLMCHFSGYSKAAQKKDMSRSIDAEVIGLMKKNNIPGLSLVYIVKDRVSIKSYGYSDLEKRIKVAPATLFELGSTSKAFTALGLLKLKKKGLISLEDKVTKYLPWFQLKYKGKAVEVSLNQLLHHTSGIPWYTISSIPQDDSKDALVHTVMKLNHTALKQPPGELYEYATVNYDILALVIQKVADTPFETFMEKEVFTPLQLYDTSLGKPRDVQRMSKGYKIGFFEARDYTAPVFKGNNAAGYVITNALDLTKWLKFQLNLSPTEFAELIQLSHERDKTVPLHGMASYAMGWEVSLDGKGEIYHGGVNPNFTSYLLMRPESSIGVAVLANSNSTATPVIARNVMKILSGEKIERKDQVGDRGDNLYSMASIIVGVYILILIGYLFLVVYELIGKERSFEALNAIKLKKITKGLIYILPFAYGVYILPAAMANFNWESVLVWTPQSFEILIVSIATAVSLTYVVYFITLLFPTKHNFKKILPKLISLSILSGFANMILIMLITSSLGSTVELKYLIFYYCLTLCVYIFSRKFVQVNLIQLSRTVVYDLRISLIEKILSTSYQNFEKIDKSRLYTSINDDVESIGEASNSFVLLITSIVTTIVAFIYLGFISFWITLITFSIIIVIAFLYYFVGKGTNIYFQEARDSKNDFVRMLNGMIEGFKELSLKVQRKMLYQVDIEKIALQYKNKISKANISFVYAFLIGESLLIILLGMIVFAIPKLFPDVEVYTLVSFVIILLYLIGPINSILGSVPAIIHIKISWKRIQVLLSEIPGNLNKEHEASFDCKQVENLSIRNLHFQYDNSEDKFNIGPINLNVERGEIIFIVGANGSGKSTFAKLITGLYDYTEGNLLINGMPVKPHQIGEFFSTVFSPLHIFDKLYDLEIESKEAEVQKYLKVLKLEDKVSLSGSRYSTINLSQGQIKRLALLQCYLEDSPIYLFDEWAADQDPTYRNFFYKTILPEMKAAGKIIIAITHDDHYFDTADRVFEMKQGKLVHYLL